MFHRVIVVMPNGVEWRDALLLAADRTTHDGVIVAANVLASAPAPLDGGPAGAARRRADLRDAGGEVYATLGPDERLRYVTLSGAPLAEAVRDLALRERADAIFIAQSTFGADESTSRLLAAAPCVVLVAPAGYRFSRQPPQTGGSALRSPSR